MALRNGALFFLVISQLYYFSEADDHDKRTQFPASSGQYRRFLTILDAPGSSPPLTAGPSLCRSAHE